MNSNRLLIYLVLGILISTYGCHCLGGDPEPIGLKCVEIDKVTKNFNFDILAKYRFNNEPIQSEGNATVIIDFYDYNLVEEQEDDICLYEVNSMKETYTENFDSNGKVTITLPATEFDNKWDNAYFTIFVHFPVSTDVDLFANTKYAVAKYDSDENYVVLFSYLSEDDL